ncbi:hypothetical protein [Deminuibacter soli]|uniref:Uncharacterized protein n=1 Tax=Deminuibacter soli TaxID=2291815 RepID=A0A3E1NM89_9BACT|nr:hypothetical protein [Deminuibacter soli]RFM29045.1 hypothetical protein DXN05_09795 [Deminuibacter soli]
MARLAQIPFNIFDFDYSDNNDAVQLVLRFLEELPDVLELFIDPTFSNFFEVSNELGYGEVLQQNSLQAMFEDARYQLLEEILVMRNAMENDPAYRERLTTELARIGFTGASLDVKFSLLNYRWRSTITPTERSGLFDFRNRFFVKPFKKFLSYLNSILGSLGSVIPGVDGIKEFKEVIENHPSLDD